MILIQRVNENYSHLRFERAGAAYCHTSTSEKSRLPLFIVLEHVRILGQLNNPCKQNFHNSFHAIIYMYIARIIPKTQHIPWILLELFTCYPSIQYHFSAYAFSRYFKVR